MIPTLISDIHHVAWDSDYIGILSDELPCKGHRPINVVIHTACDIPLLYATPMPKVF